MNETIYEISFTGRLRIDAHSLNNEGTVGNVTEPRTIVLANGEKTDGISGEMLKHIHTEAVWQIVKEKKVFLCPACQILSPMKADGNKTVTEMKETKSALNEALKCAICDLHGFLVQQPTLSRKSTIEFGWAIALPSQFYRDIHVHTRVAAGEKEREKSAKEVSEQMIYNRPTRSGVYAFVSVFQPWRIGLNEIDYTYSIDDSARKNRYELVLEAYKAMIARIEGAMTTTRLPHFGEFEGAIATTKSATPVPVISPLVDGYIQQVKTIIGQQNVQEFSNFASFMQEIDKLKSAVPYKLGAP
ncbi:MAG: DevR family CRISPR-associated autoregulator [Candidatus Bathyarchaeota archaeon]|nr:DevR family CRISPR-associated autoregulator [Candidatus Bathyarchaeota archaeon]